jgi:hypothetical protein
VVRSDTRGGRISTSTKTGSSSVTTESPEQQKTPHRSTSLFEAGWSFATRERKHRRVPSPDMHEVAAGRILRFRPHSIHGALSFRRREEVPVHRKGSTALGENEGAAASRRPFIWEASKRQRSAATSAWLACLHSQFHALYCNRSKRYGHGRKSD